MVKQRESNNNSQPPLHRGTTGHKLVQRCVVVTREPEGYGLTVTGDNPVFVQTVKEDGAAHRSGVRTGDRILKVNGMLVTNSNHMEVVRMISSGQTVALTLLGRPIEESAYLLPNRTPPHKSPTHFVEPKPVISAPLTLNVEKAEEWRKKRMDIIKQMLEEEKRNLEELRADQRRAPNDKLSAQIEQAEKRIRNLETQVGEFGSPQKSASQDRLERPMSAELPSSSSQKAPPPNRASMPPPTITAEAASEFASDAMVSAGPIVPAGMHFVTPAQVDVVPMDEDDDDDSAETVIPLDTQGPFSNFADLKNRPAHLSVFLHYLISNSDPASLLFYLITDLYQHGMGKELKRWAYEIHSTFLVPTAPFRISNMSDEYEEIDQVLSDAQCSSAEFSEECLRRLFVKSRSRALDDINEHLADFRNKRTLGLGTVFGESMLQGLVPGDRPRELKIADALLMPHFENLFGGATEMDQLDERTQGLAAGLATVIKQVLGVKPSCNLHEKLLEKCPTYVTKDKASKFKIKSMASKKAVQIKGHQFLLNPVVTTTFCYQCADMMWGVHPQAYFCHNCEVVIHKQCAPSLEDSCYPATQKKSSSGLKRPKSASSMRVTRSESSTDAPYGSPPKPGVKGPLSSEEAREDEDKTTDLPSGSPVCKEWGSKSVSSDSGYGGEMSLSADKPVGRSQSMRTRDDIIRQSKRLAGGDTSGRRAKSDVDADDKSIALAMGRPEKSGASSSSSSLGTHEAGSLPESVTAWSDKFEGDSDVEVETEIPALDEVLDFDTIKHLKPKDKKRQEIINELLHTERTHVRNLKILHRLFYTPMIVSSTDRHGMTPDFIKLLFANIDEILELHQSLNNAMKEVAAERQGDLFGDVGLLMLKLFDGQEGERFRSAAANFCQHQQYALEALRERTKKDTRLQEFLIEAESSSYCRKLQLKDMLPMEMQRLTKYPLLLESAAKYTKEPSEELDNIRKALSLAKATLEAVNTAKRNSENLRRLEDLQRKLDTASFDKENHPVSRQFRGLDLRKYTLVHDGSLSWRLAKNKSIDLHVVLLEEVLVLLTRHSDGNRLTLKYHDTSILRDSKWCPLLRLSSIMAKDVATDKKAFFLVSTSALGPQIYELVAQTATEKKKWFKLVTTQVEIVKKREGQAIEPDNKDNVAHNDSGVSDASQAEDECGAGVERVHILTQPSLVNPNEIRVAQPTVLEHAQPILTPSERLKRNDQLVIKLLTEQQHILSELLLEGGGKDKINELADTLASVEVADLKRHRDTKEVVLSAVVQANRLLEAINEGMRLKQQEEISSEEQKPELAGPESGVPSVSCFRLTGIAAPLMKHLTAMLTIMQQSDEELKRVKSELDRYKDMCESSGAQSSQLSSSDSTPKEGKESSSQPALVRPECLKVTAPPVAKEMTPPSQPPPPPPSSSPPPVASSSPTNGDEEKRRERRLQKRQRHTALTGVNDPRTADVSPPDKEKMGGTLGKSHISRKMSIGYNFNDGHKYAEPLENDDMLGSSPPRATFLGNQGQIQENRCNRHVEKHRYFSALR